MAKKNERSKEATNKSSNNRIIKLFQDERLRLVFSISLIIFSFFLLLAFVSYIFTWKADQSFEWKEVFSSANVRVENRGGKTGAEIANLFINKLFGLASFIIPFIFFLIGLRIINIRLLPLAKSLRISIVSMILLSVMLSYIFSKHFHLFGSGPGGNYGYQISEWLNALLGYIGTGLLLAVLSFTFIIFSFPATFSLLKKMFAIKQETSKDDIATEDSVENAAAKAIEEEVNNTTLSDNIEVKVPQENTIDLIIEKNTAAEETTSDAESDMVENISQPEGDIELLIEATEETMAADANISSAVVEPLGDYDPTLDLPDFKLPPLDILQKHEDSNKDVSDEELVLNKEKIVDTLKQYKIPIAKIKATIGSTVTLYEIVPEPGIRIAKIKNLEDDIALSLAALGIRIIAPIPGKGTIGIEVPNRSPQIVSMRSFLSAKKFQENDHELSIAIGKTISNETFVFDLTKAPHLLVGGATGQGKSVGLNVIIASLLYKKHPSQLKFVFIDPKRVELTPFKKLERHYLTRVPGIEEPIITDTKKVIIALNSLTVEMDRRTELFTRAEVKNIKEYNEKFVARRLNPNKGHTYLPYIVVVIDEFADLIQTAGREVESPLARLAQVARATGIHLIISTQRPAANIVTGTIKANFPTRISFRVFSMIDSRTILDSPGANQLIGRGDMLITTGNELVRVQCAFLSTNEIEDLTDFIAEQRGFADSYELPEFTLAEDGNNANSKDFDTNQRDDLFEDAAKIIVQHQQGSTSLLQRKFAIGYNRAGRLMDQLEKAGIVGPFEGSKARKVMFKDETSLMNYLKTINEDDMQLNF